MPSLIKYLALASAGKDVSKAWQEEKGNPRPLLLKGRFIGASIALGSVAISAFLGYEIDKSLLNQFVDTLNELIKNIYQIYDLINLKVLPAIGVLVGIVRYIMGEVQKRMRETETNNVGAKIETSPK
jgi:hypothetical protein